MKIYTRTGDKGQTSLVNGKRVSKASERVDTVGTVDELNSAIGVVVSRMANGKWRMAKVRSELEKMQHDLFAIGAYLASPGIQNAKFKMQNLKKRTDEFEELIDEMTEKLPPLKNFILPGGGEAGSLLHLARTVCRRAERRLVGLAKSSEIDEHVLRYFNRLSDVLFTMARSVNHKQKKKETIWKP